MKSSNENGLVMLMQSEMETVRGGCGWICRGVAALVSRLKCGCASGHTEMYVRASARKGSI